jgi:Zn-dependent protease
MALAGPAGNLLLVLIAFVLIRIGLSVGVFVSPPVIAGHQMVASVADTGWTVSAATLLSCLLTLNLVLLVFNLIPVPPLDGSSALPLLLSERATLRYMDFMRNPTFYFVGIFIAWNIFEPLFTPVMRLMLHLLYPGASYT